METKDWTLIASLLLNGALGLSSYYLASKNRRNGLRENLYKEQLSIYLALIEGAAGVLSALDECIMDLEDGMSPTQENDDILMGKLNEFGIMLDKGSILMPNAVITKCLDYKSLAYKLLNESDNLQKETHLSLLKQLDLKIENTYYDLIDVIRWELGAEALNTENKSLHKAK